MTNKESVLAIIKMYESLLLHKKISAFGPAYNRMNQLKEQHLKKAKRSKMWN